MKLLHLIHGDEVLLVQEAVDNLHEKAKTAGFTEKQIVTVDGQFDINALNDLTQNFSLFAEKKRVELRCGDKMPAELMKWLEAYANTLEKYPDLCLIVVTSKLTKAQQTTKWASAIAKFGAVMPIWDVDLSGFPRWLDGRLTQHKLKLTNEARSALIERTEGNLLASMQVILKLSFVSEGNVVDLTHLEPLLAHNAHYDLFDLMSQVLQGNMKRALRILEHLEQEGEAVLVLWAFAREVKTLIQIQEQKASIPLRDLYRKLNIWDKRQPEVESALRRIKTKVLYEVMALCADIDLMIKGLRDGNPWFALKQGLLRLC